MHLARKWILYQRCFGGFVVLWQGAVMACQALAGDDDGELLEKAEEWIAKSKKESKEAQAS